MKPPTASLTFNTPSNLTAPLPTTDSGSSFQLQKPPMVIKGGNIDKIIFIFNATLTCVYYMVTNIRHFSSYNVTLTLPNVGRVFPFIKISSNYFFLISYKNNLQ